MRTRAAAFFGRHPLFIAALVAVCCVLLATVGVAAALVGGALLAAVISWLRGWKTALMCLLCGWGALGGYLWRVGETSAGEQKMLSSPSVRMTARVLKDGKGSGRMWRAPAVLLEGPHKGFKVWWEGRGEVPVADAVVSARGSFGALGAPRNPGEFDQASWLRGQGISVVFRAGWVEGKVETGRLAVFGSDIRQGFRRGITAGLEDTSEEAAVIRAVVLGEMPSDADELVAAFRNSGTLHAFSVSGLHVTMVGAIGWFVLSAAGVSRRHAVMILIPLIFGYSWLTGNSPPAVRSAWMAAVFLGAFVFRRKPDLLNSLGAVLLVAMLWDGRLLFLPGVQLSYGVVAAIAIAGKWTTGWFSWIAKPELYLPAGMMTWRQAASLKVRRDIAQSLGVSVAAGAGSTPLTLFHFGLATPVAVFAGLAFMPLVFLLLAIALASAVIHPVVPVAAELLNKGNRWMARGCVLVAETSSAIPGGYYQMTMRGDPFLLVYDLDHGAAAACLTGANGEAVLLDCGDAYGFKRRVAPSLKRLGIVPQSVVITHPDGGHLGGGAPVWDSFPIREALLPVERSRSPAFRSWLNDAAPHGVKILQASSTKGMGLPDGARLEVLHVPDVKASGIAADDRVAIYRVHWREWKILFTSDAGVATELAVLDAGVNVSADVIIAGKHGEDLRLCDRFLDAVRPSAIIASHSDFPAAEKLDPSEVSYWKSRGIEVFHQGDSGAVTLRVMADGNLRLEGFVDHSASILRKN